MEMCTDSVIEAQHAIMLDTSLFTSSNGNCVCRFNITGSFLDIGHLDYPEQCGSKLDFRLGPEGSPSSEVQSIDCTKITAEFNATEVRDGSVVITHTEAGVADPGFCVSMETDPNGEYNNMFIKYYQSDRGLIFAPPYLELCSIQNKLKFDNLYLNSWCWCRIGCTPVIQRREILNQMFLNHKMY